MAISLVLLPSAFLLYLFKTGPLSSSLLLLAFVVSAVGAILLFKRKQYVSSLFVLAYLLMYFPNPFLIGLGILDLERGTSDNLFALSNAMLVVGIALFLLGTNVTKPRYGIPLSVRIYVSRQTISTVLVLLMALAIFAFFFTIAFGGGWAALTAERAQYGRTWIRLTSVYMFMPFLAAAPLLITQLSGPLQTMPWIFTIGILLGNFFLFRARTPLLTVMSSVAIGILLKNRVFFVYEQLASARFRAFRRYFFVAVLVPTILVFGVTVNFLRGYISLGGVRLARGFTRIWVEQTFDGGDLGYTKIQRASYVLFPRVHPFLMGQSYYRLLFVPVPRFLMPNKPENTQRVFCSVIDPPMYWRGGTIPPGILGDLYINFGHLGVIGMFFFGLVFGRERYRKMWQWLVLGGCLTWLFHIVRGGFTNPVVTLIVYAAISILLEHAIRPDYEIYEDVSTEEIGLGGPGLEVSETYL